ncbi:methionine--tRNA ligase [Agrococcus jenensis]|uniref:Methionine--tRNA ligase n=1 Tax=Agrococcus jenensis TaxID=46353 RepID=A0A3N2ATQ5_9MICO|nr:methionine--tRNA ligase [Agrococcus jenensis]ROR66288.1 methionyl-tRNA synthetase [Agrococcus jenensis]
MPERFTVTTPIYYVNDVPHIGHAYNEVATDVLARWHRQRGDDTWMLTGTDEHGQKIMRTAAANGVSPQEWTDRLVETAWIPQLELLNIANDDFIRTTDERHKAGVRIFLERLKEAGYIYHGEFEGQYCVGCEEYKTPNDLVPGTGEFEGQLVCAIHSRPIETVREANYFFKLSEFGDRLLALYDERPDYVQPEHVRNEVRQFVKQGLNDLSISRNTFDWGIKVPWDETHVVYVWFEALLNYITANGYGVDEERFARRWPATHIVGKDIARFHAVIWPAMQMAAGLEISEHVFGHGWLLVGGEKMSKSKATGIEPRQITEVFGVDAFRYYFMSAIAFGSDGSFSWEDLDARYHSELANGLGNLASRVIAMVHKYCDGVVPAVAIDDDIQTIVADAVRRADEAIDRFAIDESVDAAMAIVERLNGYITEQAPWVLAKDDAQRDRLAAVLASNVHGIGAVAVLLAPVMPESAQKLWAAVGGEGDVLAQPIREAHRWEGTGRVTTVPPLFPRIEQAQPAA